MKKNILILIALLFTKAQAQDFLGLQSSNYAGVVGAYTNPANIVDSRFKTDIVLGGLNFTFDNNYFGVKRKSLNFSGGNIFSDPSWNNNDPNSPDYWKNNYQVTNNGKDKAVLLSTRITLPSFLITLNKKNAVAFTSSFRNYINIDGISQQLANIIHAEFIYPTVFLTRLSNKNLSLQQMAWAEYGLSYARVIKEEGDHFIKAGFTAKLLQGVMASYLYIRDLQYELHQDTSMSFFNTDVSYGHSNNVDFNNLNAYNFTSSPSAGFDIGAVYEWRPNYRRYKYDMDGKTDLWYKDKNKYFLKAALAVTDIGGIKFKKGNYSNDFVADVNQYNLSNFENINNFNDFDSLTRADFGRKDVSNTFKVALPTAINLQVDVNPLKNIYVNLMANITNLHKNREAKVHDYTNISLAPRFENRWFSLAIPVSYNGLAASRGGKDITSIGIMMRLGPLVVGSNNVLGYISRDIYGANVYAMLKIPVLYRTPSDKDKDGVSDRYDKCMEVYGTLEFSGCPDTDEDHIPDSEDKCPTVAGVKALRGCPDRDDDGITDEEDACPDTKGLEAFNGCPDTDGDKIPDKDDACPDDAGLAEFKGCPDSDADGVPDKDDACPDVFGAKEHKGCPDKDGDGIIDKEDRCSEIAGPIENKGCPWPDEDGDGIPDKDDACPHAFGVESMKGCPLIEEKKKPANPTEQTVPMKAEEKKIIEKAFASLEFAPAKDIIKPTSYPGLDGLAKLMIEHAEEWKLKLSGHTDNVGKPEENMILSEKRTIAVKNYLIKKGVNEEQIITEWFGQTQPIADNKTPKGKQKNRRVEMKIMLKE